MVENGDLVYGTYEEVVPCALCGAGTDTQDLRRVGADRSGGLADQLSVDVESLLPLVIDSRSVRPFAQGDGGSVGGVPATGTGAHPELPGVARLDVDDVAPLGIVVA